VLTLVVAPAGVIQWRIQSARERRQRTVELLLRYDSSELLAHRAAAWRFLRDLDGPVSTAMDPLLVDPSGSGTSEASDRGDDAGFGAVFVVLRFFDLIARLRSVGHLDAALTDLLFEEHRAAWAEALRPFIEGTRPDEPHFGLLAQIARPLTPKHS
jgi:hypothetical protein